MAAQDHSPQDNESDWEPILPEKEAWEEDTSGPFYRKMDWVAFVLTFLISLIVYIGTLAPSVTLEDSGELVVAADYLGVPHPPGYPIWTLLAWFFQWVFHFVTYYGQPNPAWSVGLLSAVFGALAAGILAMLVSRSGVDYLRSNRHVCEGISDRAVSFLSWIGGVTSGLLFAFSPVLWSQSVIVEVYSLNAFFLTLIFLLTYHWMARPKESYLLYITAFAFGLGFTNHQSLLFAGVGMAAAVAFRDLKLFRDCVAAGCWLLAILLISKAVSMSGGNLTAAQLDKRSMYYIVAAILTGATIGIFAIGREIMTEARRALAIIGSAVVGFSFYLYLPVASDQNPPMNWGYPRTKEGFWHAFSRGQYEKISPVDNLQEFFADPGKGFELFYKVIFSPTDFVSVVWQFTWPMAAFVIIAFVMFGRSTWKLLSWFLVSVIFFFFLTVVFLIFQWPDPDVQTLFIGRVQYIQCHAIYAMWIGYGVIFALMLLEGVAKRALPNLELAYIIGLACAIGLPYALVYRNFHSKDPEYWKYVGGVEQNGHDFGWQFGNYQLRGVNAILEELNEGEEPPPSSEFPPEMDEGAIFFGGTDPGRFVPTYMIYSAKVREDVYLITQNALADNTYMNVMRDLYGDSIWIPAQTDSNNAFKKYVSDVQSGRIDAGADVSMAGGKVSVQGVAGVMRINGILAKDIFDYNKHKHSFYVEESYVIPWMYPHLIPHGLIMKINKTPLPRLTDEMVKNDMEFWAWYSKRLLDNPKFRRDVVARKTFSKLRSAIGGLYIYRRLYDEAEKAFQEAIALYDLSPEANFRLADSYVQRKKFTEAKELIREFLVKDPNNAKVAAYLKQIETVHKKDAERTELEQTLAKGADINKAMRLLTLYAELNMTARFENLVNQILSNKQVPPVVCRQLANLCAQARRPDLAIRSLDVYTQKKPNDSGAWIEFAAAQVATKRVDAAIASIEKAIEIGGNKVKNQLRGDKRFAALQQVPKYQKLVPPVKPTSLKF